MKVEFTPGPWIVSEAGQTNEGQRAIVTSEKRVALVDMQREGVKRVERWHAEDPERDANASLIAAAPELLVRLIDAVGALEAYQKLLPDAHIKLEIAESKKAIALARQEESLDGK